MRLLHEHPGFEVVYLGGKGSVGQRFGTVHPHLAGLPEGDLTLRELEPAAIADAAELVFSALPNGTSASLAPAILDAGALVIDLAGDFRLPAEAYPEWYGFEHPAAAWLDEAVYGLPELFHTRIAGAKLIANPGCYATAAIMSCAPVLAAGLVEPGPIRIDGKTGVSGAGRAAVESTSFGATEDSIRPYRFPSHQHTPEIERGIELGDRSGDARTVRAAPRPGGPRGGDDLLPLGRHPARRPHRSRRACVRPTSADRSSVCSSRARWSTRSARGART